LDHETRGAVTLKRLPPSHPQYQRCERAATENVKRGYFDDRCSLVVSSRAPRLFKKICLHSIRWPSVL
jgi:hypothetical protein